MKMTSSIFPHVNALRILITFHDSELPVGNVIKKC